ncbi:hypothetical protein EHI47_21985 [Rhizobium leguminosarum]|jgi:hypothetical protein|uniref:DUF2946 domain-containing protein n=1 Tax=Rhizobium leguminosarum TaxID=384 RepID=A0A444HU41_RHILE|nr:MULTISPECIES: hypothetical protein [Rhizobium]MBY5459612.1 hypothetical protein [Rhizobium leguminosarum]NKL63408.1 hypothetical protein [Rhizobium leguminosarum bv. viciae]RWX10656.1 hypothetical protein EHI45_20055 [Rhizobium leguminosarum]RWX26962.1 hypothetical protein EHI47_21985 [Rhizobium leguminosarum]TAU51773.1 hypothetical protein ELI43_02510 [Rhizobium leguminosarum]
MRTLALITMFLGWLVYSAMSAWAGCPTCASMNAPAAIETGMHHKMAGMDMPQVAEKAAPSKKDPCASGNAAHMPLCAACLLLPPAVTVMASGKSIFGYPAPALARALDDNKPTPQPPPPRLF